MQFNAVPVRDQVIVQPMHEEARTLGLLNVFYVLEPFIDHEANERHPA